MPSRTYRYRPWLAWSAVVLLFTIGFAVPVVGYVFREASIAAVAKAFLILVPLTAFAAFLIGGCRVRTVIDDEAITQHWITSTYRIPYAEITGLERDASSSRWFLRILRGEQTYEVIPCQQMALLGGLLQPGPPLVLLAVEAEIEARLPPEADRPAP
ncbi:hypothetical protein OHA21_22270 [Actinoplanes sp. NBC_00393]|uniref:hypothetical protein n=1 Tax=Actinoplanes sp. NBC_00393 TaxID=2975953 RepID=UPI002E1B08B3